MQTSENHLKSTATENDPRWSAVVNRDPSADGQFFYAVLTTGIFCRPSCGARLARPENVSFHLSAAHAVAAGYRPCKRCKPDTRSLDERNAALVTQACRLIENAESTVSLDELAGTLGLSRYHFHRIFKAETGLTPRQYGAAERARRVRENLDQSETVVAAIYDAGFNSDSRFYEHAQDLLGMTPTAYRSGGRDARIYFAVGECSFGAILVAQSEHGICAISLSPDPDGLTRELQDQFSHAELIGADRDFEQIVAQVVGFIDDPSLGLNLPLDIRGTAFQRRVWQALRTIPVGQTKSYAEVAALIGAPKSARAVARACAANVLAVAIPCHRVVRGDGGLSGYRWGVEVKRALLEQEATA